MHPLCYLATAMSGLRRMFLCLLVTTSLPPSLATSIIAIDPPVAEERADTGDIGPKEEKEEADNPPSPPEEDIADSDSDVLNRSGADNVYNSRPNSESENSDNSSG